MSNTVAAEQEGSRAGRETGAPSARWGLASLALCTVSSALGTSLANVALPTLAQAFRASFQEVQWVVLAYLLGLTVFVVGAGRLGDAFGRRRLLLAGLAVFTAASALCGLAPTLWMLIALRAVQGLGAAVLMALSLALVGEAVPQSRMGSAMGLLGAASAIGTALGPSLGGALLAGLGWRAVFLVQVPLGLVALLLGRGHLPAAGSLGREGRVGLDGAGTLLLDPVLSAGLAASALVSTVTMATLVVGPFYLSRALGLGAARVGLVLSAGPLVAALAGLPAGRLVDRFGARPVARAGLVWMAAGAGLLGATSTGLGVLGYVVPLVVLTSGYALFQAANNTAVLTGIDPHRRGVVSGLLNLARNLGLVTGASVMGAVFAAGSGASDVAAAPAAAVESGLRSTFAAALGLILAALALGLRSPARVARGSTTACSPDPRSRTGFLATPWRARIGPGGCA